MHEVYCRESSHKEAQKAQKLGQNFLCFLCLFVAITLQRSLR